MILRWNAVPMGEDEVLNVIEKATQSVVNVNTVRVFRDIFYRVVPVKGMGSGFIIDNKGFILTNHHVIAGAREIAVTLTDGRALQGWLEGTSRSSDVAVIKVNESKLTPIELGNSDNLRVGQKVFAIGNPFGLVGGPTVTSGVISALDRTIQAREGVFKGLVQTDAAINPGNSGGPLIDVEGKVVAINTAIIPFAQGIGFAIPINAAKSCLNDILVHGEVRRAWLGLTGLTVNRNVAAQYRLPVERGVLVLGIESDSPAEKSDVRQGDIIIEFDNRTINRVEDLQQLLQERTAGDKVNLIILRDSKTGKMQITLERMP